MKNIIKIVVLLISTTLSVSGFANHGDSSESASLSTDTVNIAVDESGSWSISGNDGGNQHEFRWSLPSGLNISTGSGSNLNNFRVRSDKGYLQVETDGGGNFSATINVSSSNTGTYTMQNELADISLSPSDVTINVGSGGTTSGGGGESASLSTDTVNIAVDESGSWSISGNDDGNQREFRWSLPSGLNVSTGSGSNLNNFRVRSDKGYLQVETDGGGNFSATVNVSSSNTGTYTMQNELADISLSPSDVTINVGSGGTTSGGTTTGGTMDGGGGGGGAAAATGIPVFDAGNVSLVVRRINKTMSDGNNVNFWVFCEGGMGGDTGDGMAGGCTLPGPVLELNVGQQANVTLNMMMAPEEAAPYGGHTIHHHGVDVVSAEDGVPETSFAVFNNHTYTFSVDSRYVGGHMYHCHVHTVKHLEMGMYGALIVKDGNNINSGGPTYDFEWNMVLSSVDPAYHTNAAVQDSTVFADYNPRYFLINGEEGLSTNAPAEVFTAAPGASVAVRIIGLHSLNSRFELRDENGNRQSFTWHNTDGFALPSSKTVTSLEVSPGQTKDLMINLPNSSGTWYPEISYRDLRNNRTYSGGTVYTQLNF